MSDERTTSDILEESTDLYESKEDDYGKSWRLAGEALEMILKQQGVETLEIPVDSTYLNSFGLFFRRFDKFSRAFNGTFVKDEMDVDESVPETQRDQVPYAAMHTLLAEEMAEDSGDGIDREGTRSCPDCSSSDVTEIYASFAGERFRCLQCASEWGAKMPTPPQ